LTTVLKRHIPDMPLEKMCTLDLERYKKIRADAKVSPATVNRSLAHLKHAFSLASQWEWTSAESAIALRRVKLMREPPGRTRHLQGDEEERLVAAMTSRPRAADIIVTCLLTGMRREEALSLRQDAVDLESMVITLDRTKSNKVRRIPICDELQAVLERAMGRSKGYEYVFTSRRGKRYTSNGFRSAWDRIVAEAGIEDFHLHDLRHTFATRLRRRGVGVDVLAKLLGHSTLSMTTRYAHVEADLLRDAVSKLPELAKAKT
jgi:integrase